MSGPAPSDRPHLGGPAPFGLFAGVASLSFGAEPSVRWTDQHRVTARPDGTVTTTGYGFGADRDGIVQFETDVTDRNGNVKQTYADIRQLNTAIKESNLAAGQAVIWTSYAYSPLKELTSVVDDQHNTVLVSRVATLLVGVATLVTPVAVNDVAGALTVAYDLLTGALFVPIVGALFWRRATAAGALASMAAGSVAVVFFMVKDGLFANSPIIWGLVASLVVFVVVSLLTPKPSEESMAAWERRLTEGGTAQISE